MPIPGNVRRTIRRYSGQPRPSNLRIPKRMSTKGLNKTEKRETREIAKKVLNSQAESKYFNVRDIDDLTNGGSGLVLVPARGSYPQMQVLGFATGTGAQTSGVTLTYGVQPSGAAKSIQALQHGRIFGSGDANGYDIQGSYVTPSLNTTEFNFQRITQSTTDDATACLNTTPYMVRILRLTPRPVKGSFQDMNPNEDAFLDQFSQEIGIRAANFTHYELHLLKANSKKYKVIQDIKFMMNPAVTYNSLDIGTGDFQVSSYSNNCVKQMLFKHDIGKKLFYETPNDVSNPADGFKNEYILIHVVPVGHTDLSTVRPENVRLGVKAVGTFKDY